MEPYFLHSVISGQYLRSMALKISFTGFVEKRNMFVSGTKAGEGEDPVPDKPVPGLLVRGNPAKYHYIRLGLYRISGLFYIRYPAGYPARKTV